MCVCVCVLVRVHVRTSACVTSAHVGPLLPCRCVPIYVERNRPACVLQVKHGEVMLTSARRRRRALHPALIRMRGGCVRVSMPSAGIECTQQDYSMCPEFLNGGQARKRASSTVFCFQRRRRPTAGHRLKANSCALSGVRSRPPRALPLPLLHFVYTGVRLQEESSAALELVCLRQLQRVR